MLAGYTDTLNQLLIKLVHMGYLTHLLISLKLAVRLMCQETEVKGDAFQPNRDAL